MSPKNNKRTSNPYYTYGILYLSPNFHHWEESQGNDYREYRREWVERIRRLDYGEFPLNMNFEITTRCNLACTFCTHSSLTKEQTGDMPWELFTQVADECAEFKTPTANFNGLGEPMLVRALPKMIAYAKERGFVDVMFHTNGTILTERSASALIEANLDKIIFSVDSPDKETYEAMRINARWERVVANVRTFAKLRSKMGRNVPLIRTTMVVTDNTVTQVQDFVDLWRPIADQITLQDLTWRTKLLTNGQWENREKSAIPINFDEVREKAIEQGIAFVCPYLYQSAYAFWNGDFIPCSNPNARTLMVMGQLGKQSVHEIWHGEKYQELRDLHISGRWFEHPICRECEVPLVELYKKLSQENVKFSDNDTNLLHIEDIKPRTAAEFALEDSSTEDLAKQFDAE